MKIGILQTGRVPDELRDKHGDYDDMFRRFLSGKGFEFVTYPVLDGILPDGVRDADGWLITGSKFGVYEDHDWISPLEEFIRKAYASSVPIVGICFGHQIIAQALGGKVEKFSGGWSVGNVDHSFDGFPEDVQLLAWHQDQVIEPPADATEIGSTPFCKYAALLYGDKAYSIQPHPEFTADYLAELIPARRAILPDEIAQKALNNLGPEPSSNEIADRIANFFKARSLV